MDLIKLKNQLKQEYPYRIELHAHTKPASSCGDIPPEEVVRLFAEAGYSGIAVTNHFYTGAFENYFGTTDKKKGLAIYLDDYYRAFEAGEKLGIRVYLGAELRWDHLSDNDYLLFGIDESMLYDVFDYMKADPETFVRECKSEKSFFLQAHPFRYECSPIDPDLLDGIEALNMHPNHNSKVAVAEKFAEENHKIKTIGTDYHHSGHHGLCATRMKILPKDSFALAAELKQNDFLREIGGSIVLP